MTAPLDLRQPSRLRAGDAPRALLAVPVRVALIEVSVMLLTGGLLGWLLRPHVSAADPPSAVELLHHNLVVGLVVVLVGWISLGVAAHLMVSLGMAVNGFAIGAAVASLGFAHTAGRFPHLLVEGMAFTLFLAAAITPGWPALTRPLRRSGGGGVPLRSGLGAAWHHMAYGLVLLAVAAPLEASVGA